MSSTALRLAGCDRGGAAILQLELVDSRSEVGMEMATSDLGPIKHFFFSERKVADPCHEEEKKKFQLPFRD
jgi:hypothetical protein